METTAPRPFCFVLMPFEPTFADIYKIGIKEACAQSGAYCERVDEQIFNGPILDRILNQIAKADFIVADMTGRNANVFYEVGYAHALDKRTILLTKKADDIPFDLKHFPHIIYGDSVFDLREQLIKRLSWFISHPETTRAQTRDQFLLFLGDKPLAEEELEHTFFENEYPYIGVVIQNTSTSTLKSDGIKVAYIFPKESKLSQRTEPHASVTKLPDGRIHYLMPDRGDIFPGQFVMFLLRFELTNFFNTPAPVIICVYTDQGPREYHITMRRTMKAALA